jgi:glycosyltransferase involved in cell wall biosynthesis
VTAPPTAPVQVGVNLLWMVPGEVGGSEEYTVRLLRALARQGHPGVELTVFVNGRTPAAHPELVAAHPTVVAPVSGSSRPQRVLAESTWLAVESRRRRLEVVHHAGGTMPPVRAVPGLVTIHDLQPLSHPERFGQLKRRYIALAAPRSLRAARLVLALTAFTAADVVSRCGVPPAAVRLVPAGVDDPGPDPTAGRIAEVEARYALAGRRVVLYPAITYAHKNHETLVRAMASVVARHPDVVLVLTGGAGPIEELVTAAVAARGLTGHVRRTGRIPADDLDVLYRLAAVTAFPSAYEGFGLPVLEAMARGCPVVVADAGALPSVAGGAADVVAPYDAAAWSAALLAVLERPAHAAHLAAAGRRRAADFPWSAAATALHDAYLAAAGRTGPTAVPPISEPR